jgi:hypothetical protein
MEYYYGHDIKYEIGGTYSMNDVMEKLVHNFSQDI